MILLVRHASSYHDWCGMPRRTMTGAACLMVYWCGMPHGALVRHASWFYWCGMPQLLTVRHASVIDGAACLIIDSFIDSFIDCFMALHTTLMNILFTLESSLITRIHSPQGVSLG